MSSSSAASLHHGSHIQAASDSTLQGYPSKRATLIILARGTGDIPVHELQLRTTDYIQFSSRYAPAYSSYIHPFYLTIVADSTPSHCNCSPLLLDCCAADSDCLPASQQVSQLLVLESFQLLIPRAPFSLDWPTPTTFWSPVCTVARKALPSFNPHNQRERPLQKPVQDSRI